MRSDHTSSRTNHSNEPVPPLPKVEDLPKPKQTGFVVVPVEALRRMQAGTITMDELVTYLSKQVKGGAQ